MPNNCVKTPSCFYFYDDFLDFTIKYYCSLLLLQEISGMKLINLNTGFEKIFLVYWMSKMLAVLAIAS